MQSILPADVDNHFKNLINSSRSVSTIKKALDVINAAYEWAVARGELDYNPALQIKKGITKRLSKLETKNASDADVIVLSEDEQDMFISEALKANDTNGRYVYAGGLYGCLLLHTGMRVGELISLRWKDYDFENSLITINKSTSMSRNRKLDMEDSDDNAYVAIQGTTKNQKARVIQLFPEAIEDLQRIRDMNPGKPDDLICRSRNGNQYTATMLEHCMATIYKHIDFNTKVSGLHIFRRTFATRMYENGADVKEIAAYIGDLESTTMQYYIAARKKMVIGDTVRQYVPLPGSRKTLDQNAIEAKSTEETTNEIKRDVPAGNKNTSE